MKFEFSIKELIGRGWELTKEHFGMWLKLGVVIFLVLVVPQVVTEFLPEELSLLALVLGMVMVVV